MSDAAGTISTYGRDGRGADPAEVVGAGRRYHEREKHDENGRTMTTTSHDRTAVRSTAVRNQTGERR